MACAAVCCCQEPGAAIHCSQELLGEPVVNNSVGGSLGVLVGLQGEIGEGTSLVRIEGIGIVQPGASDSFPSPEASLRICAGIHKIQVNIFVVHINPILI